MLKSQQVYTKNWNTKTNKSNINQAIPIKTSRNSTKNSRSTTAAALLLPLALPAAQRRQESNKPVPPNSASPILPMLCTSEASSSRGRSLLGFSLAAGKYTCCMTVIPEPETLRPLTQTLKPYTSKALKTYIPSTERATWAFAGGSSSRG